MLIFSATLCLLNPKTAQRHSVRKIAERPKRSLVSVVVFRLSPASRVRNLTERTTLGASSFPNPRHRNDGSQLRPVSLYPSRLRRLPNATTADRDQGNRTWLRDRRSRKAGEDLIHPETSGRTQIEPVWLGSERGIIASGCDQGVAPVDRYIRGYRCIVSAFKVVKKKSCEPIECHGASDRVVDRDGKPKMLVVA